MCDKNAIDHSYSTKKTALYIWYTCKLFFFFKRGKLACIIVLIFINVIIRIPNGFLLKNFVYIGIKDEKIMARIS